MIKFKSESAVHLSQLDAKSAVYNIALTLLMYLLEELDGTMICSKIINFFRRGMSYSAYFENTLRLTSCFKYVPRIPTKAIMIFKEAVTYAPGVKEQENYHTASLVLLQNLGRNDNLEDR